MAKKAAAEGKSSKKKSPKKAGVKKTKKDANAPKHNKSAYIFFCEDHRAEVKAKYPDLKMTELSKKLGELWHSVSADEKKKCEKLAADDKKRYEKEKAAYDAKKGAE